MMRQFIARIMRQFEAQIYDETIKTQICDETVQSSDC